MCPGTQEGLRGQGIFVVHGFARRGGKGFAKEATST